jgi:hypothetical protein
MSRNRGGIFGSITFLLGLVFGGFLTLLLSTDEKGDMKKTVKNTVSDIKQRLKEVSEKERIEAIFGDVSKEATERYQEARELFINKLAGLKQAVNTVDKEKYMAIIGEVTDELKKEGAMTAQQLKKLTNYLAEDYKKVTKKDSASKKKSV